MWQHFRNCFTASDYYLAFDLSEVHVPSLYHARFLHFDYIKIDTFIILLFIKTRDIIFRAFSVIRNYIKFNASILLLFIGWYVYRYNCAVVCPCPLSWILLQFLSNDYVKNVFSINIISIVIIGRNNNFPSN